MTAQTRSVLTWGLIGPALGMLMTAAPALAQSSAPATEPYGTIYGGAIVGGEAEAEFAGFTFDEDLDTEFTGGFTLGLKSNLSGPAALRGEGDVNYSRLGEDSDLWNFLANGWVDIGTDGPLTPYLGGGIGLGVLDIDGLDTETGLAYQVGGGINVDVTPDGDLFVGVGYRYFGFATEIEDVDVDVNGHKVIGTVGAKF